LGKALANLAGKNTSSKRHCLVSCIDHDAGKVAEVDYDVLFINGRPSAMTTRLRNN
jgi:hypothetical protein